MRINKYTTHKGEENLPCLVKEFSCNYTTEKNLNTPQKIVNMLNDVFKLNKQTEENLYMLCLDAKCNLQGIFEVSRGTVNTSVASPREIYMKALLCGATHIVITHNHPSGDTTPSLEDVNVTRRIKEVGQLLNLKLLDHIIIGDDYYSFKENENIIS